jgi:hypothetical protein
MYRNLSPFDFAQGQDDGRTDLPLSTCSGQDDSEGRRQSNPTSDSSASLRNDNKRTCNSNDNINATATATQGNSNADSSKSDGARSKDNGIVQCFRRDGVFSGSIGWVRRGRLLPCGCFFLDGLGLENEVLTLPACSCSQGTVFVFDPAEGAYEESLHLGSGAGDCGWDVGGVVGNGECLVMFMTDFEAAAFVLRSGLVPVFIAEMDLNTGELVFESVQDAVKIRLDQVGEFVVHGDVFIAAYLNLHSLNSFSLACEVRRISDERSGRVF